MTGGALALQIAQTWDGAPIGASEQVAVRLSADGPSRIRIDIDAPLHGDPAPASPVGPTWALWEHEVVELFVLGPDEEYTEIEVGPWGHHLVLQLRGRRNIVARELPLDCVVRRSEGRWKASVSLSRALLPSGPHRVNAYAIHGVGPARRYLAWAPTPGEGPDFHRLEAFREVTLPA